MKELPKKWCIVRDDQRIINWFNTRPDVPTTYQMLTQELIHYPPVNGSCLWMEVQRGYIKISLREFEELVLKTSKSALMNSLPKKWHVAITPETQKVIGAYYDKQTEGTTPFYETDPHPNKYLKSHDGVSHKAIQEGGCRCSFYESDPASDSVLISFEDFKRFVLGISMVKETSPLPKNWYIKITSENYDAVGKWRQYGEFCTFSKQNPKGYCTSPDGHHEHTLPSSNYREISFEDFQRYVLKTTPLAKPSKGIIATITEASKSPIIVNVPKI